MDLIIKKASATPGGANTNIQYNDSGAFGGDNNFTWNKSTVQFKVNGGIWSNGATGGTPTSGLGTRLMWIPAKSAFRAGEAAGSEWDNASIGTRSVGFGFNNYANGLEAFVAGSSNISGGESTAAFGQENTAGGTASLVSGHGVLVDGNGAFGIGWNEGGSILGSAWGSIVFGQVSASSALVEIKTNSGGGSMAGGYASDSDSAAATIEAIGGGSVAIGIVTSPDNPSNITASGDGSVALGAASSSDLLSTGSGSMTLGIAANGSILQATNSGSVAMGASFGGGTLSSSGAGSIAMGACGGSFTFSASGTGSVALGYSNSANVSATGTASVAIGQDVNATAANAIAIGSSFTNATASTLKIGFSTNPQLNITDSLTGVKVANTTTFAKVGGVIFDHFTDVNNGTTVETDLYTDTLPASTFNTNGQKVTALYQGIFTGAAAATQQIKVYFGGTVIYDSGALSIGIATNNWTVNVAVIRDSSSSVRCATWVNSDFATLFPYSKYVTVTGLTLTNTQIIKITGTAAGAGGASNQITAKLGYVEWKNNA